MAIIHLVGTNSIGKTTAVERYAGRYGSLLVCVSADISRVLDNGCVTRQPGWNGAGATESVKQQLVAGWRQANKVVVIESARTTTANFATPDDVVIIVTCSAVLSKASMQRRCAMRNKVFKADYWTDRKLNYESSARYLNFAKKHLVGIEVLTTHINDQAQDWPVVDELFYSVFRRLHNARKSK